MNRRLLLFLFVVALGLFAVATTWLGNRMRDQAEAIRVLEPRRFDGMTAVFVGTGGGPVDTLRRGPAVAIGSDEALILVDAGRGVAGGLRAAGIPVSQPRRVYLTSLLPENTEGLDDLLLGAWLELPAEPLVVVGPPGTRALVDGLLAAHRAGIDAQVGALGLPPAGARMEALEVEGGPVPAPAPLEVRARLLPGGPLPTLAYRVERGRASVALVGSAWGEDALLELARGADLLVHEAWFSESLEMAIAAGASDPERLRREAAWRTPLETAGERARRAEVRALALVRLRPPPLFAFQASHVAARAYRGEIRVPDDGYEITLTP